MTQRKSIVFLVLFMVAVSALNIFSQSNTSEKFSGVGYFDYTYHTNGDPEVNNEFEFQRVYFTYENTLSEKLKYKFQTDVGRTDNGKLDVYLKNANMSWKTDLGQFVFGLQGMNVFSVQEKTWGYRFIEKSAMDLYKFSSSADLAIGYYNNLTDDLAISALVSNGTGYKKGEDDKYKKISANVVYGKSNLSSKEGFNVGGIISLEPYKYQPTSGEILTENKTVLGVFGGFSGYNIRIGGEFNQFVTGGKDVTESLFSVYANYSISELIDLFARIDNFDPNTDLDKNGSNYIIAGVVVNPVKGLTIAPNIRYTSPETGDSETLAKVNFEFKF